MSTEIVKTTIHNNIRYYDADEISETFRAYWIPRNKLKNVWEELDIDKPGIYILLNGFKSCYVGQAVSLKNRTNNHCDDVKCPGWNSILMFTVRTNNQTDIERIRTARHALEEHVYSELRDKYDIHVTNQIVPKNNNGKPHKLFPKSCSLILDNIFGILKKSENSEINQPVISEPKIEVTQTVEQNVKNENDDIPDDYYHYTVKVGKFVANSKIECINGKWMFYILKGSECKVKPTEMTQHCKYVLNKTNQLLESGVIVMSDDEKYIFKEDVLFESPGLAIGFLYRDNHNEFVKWKTKSGLSIVDVLNVIYGHAYNPLIDLNFVQPHTYVFKQKGAYGIGVWDTCSDGFKLLKPSLLTKNAQPCLKTSCLDVYNKIQTLVEQKVIVKTGSQLQFVKEHVFASINQATNVLSGGRYRGGSENYWISTVTSKSLGDLYKIFNEWGKEPII